MLWCGKCFPSQCFPDMTLLIDPSVSADSRSPWLCMAALPLNYFPLLPVQISESELIWEQQPEEEQSRQSSVVGLKTFVSAVRMTSGCLGRNQTCRPGREIFQLYTLSRLQRELQFHKLRQEPHHILNVLENHLEWEHSAFLPLSPLIKQLTIPLQTRHLPNTPPS